MQIMVYGEPTTCENGQGPTQTPNQCLGRQGRGHCGRGHRGPGHHGPGHRGPGHHGPGHHGRGHHGPGHHGGGHHGPKHHGHGHHGHGHHGHGHHGHGHHGHGFGRFERCQQHGSPNLRPGAFVPSPQGVGPCHNMPSGAGFHGHGGRFGPYRHGHHGHC